MYVCMYVKCFFIILVINFSIAQFLNGTLKCLNLTHLNLQACTCKIDRQFVQFIIIYLYKIL